jgi:hypothetical protein
VHIYFIKIKKHIAPYKTQNLQMWRFEKIPRNDTPLFFNFFVFFLYLAPFAEFVELDLFGYCFLVLSRPVIDMLAGSARKFYKSIL